MIIIIQPDDSVACGERLFKNDVPIRYFIREATTLVDKWDDAIDD